MNPEKETELFATLASIMTLLSQQNELLRQQGERIARIEGILANAPQSAEFYRLEGRVEEISRPLPTTLAYTAPAAKTA